MYSCAIIGRLSKHLQVLNAGLWCTGEAAPDAAPDRSCLQQKPLLRLLDSQKQKTARRLIIFMRALSAVVALVAFILGLFQRLLRTVAPSKAKQVCFMKARHSCIVAPRTLHNLGVMRLATCNF